MVYLPGLPWVTQSQCSHKINGVEIYTDRRKENPWVIKEVYLEAYRKRPRTTSGSIISVRTRGVGIAPLPESRPWHGQI